MKVAPNLAMRIAVLLRSVAQKEPKGPTIPGFLLLRNLSNKKRCYSPPSKLLAITAVRVQDVFRLAVLSAVKRLPRELKRQGRENTFNQMLLRVEPPVQALVAAELRIRQLVVLMLWVLAEFRAQCAH